MAEKAHRFIVLSILVIACFIGRFLTPPEQHTCEFQAANIIFQRAADMFDQSFAFASYGKQIANGLRQLSEELVRAGNSFKKMYRNGFYVFETFQTEIETLFNILDSKMTDKSNFFKERTERMLKVVKEFRTHVRRTKSAMLDVDGRRNDLETNIFAGMREVQKFIKEEWRNSQTDIVIAKRESEVAVDVLKCFQSTGKKIDTILKILDEHESNLLDV
ncbi:8395_t:CDS:2 [Paraglomus occultum]|uniref:8395_t:CDS:1 n=1 Tax=Paraglomus occultum TaxID=144539 RepID=A0A9N9GTR2_9GLOM|nr:8395_t:CDS:2 [Paraglomus occultum]